MSKGTRHNGDATQKVRLARILRNPADYFADARKDAHEDARRALTARIEARAAESR
ncbi:hypothetical protein WEH80_31460 [Actinomycetes bacterium KLBMP 9759]